MTRGKREPGCYAWESLAMHRAKTWREFRELDTRWALAGALVWALLVAGVTFAIVRSADTEYEVNWFRVVGGAIAAVWVPIGLFFLYRFTLPMRFGVDRRGVSWDRLSKCRKFKWREITRIRVRRIAGVQLIEFLASDGKRRWAAFGKDIDPVDLARRIERWQKSDSQTPDPV